ncbi:class I SAM-dependent methyltransferase [Hyphomonas sp. WL0036]|uniref:class I SAM-dependent methyltransferase n=1 Tax=Hyphomonas sediminis TaxID=2866160 RepID=UPI001C7F7179|nr:class I SAM-dependent methyltransferase [Hyphomonas sediminis]MBY9068124.1 class I SAM-dependent methyltransferase [Hyphomonas sediminis]
MDKRLEKDARFWDRIAASYAADPIKDEGGYRRTIGAVIEHLAPGDRVYEMGCGTGTTALKLASHVRRYAATDISGEMIAIARQKAQAAQCQNLDFEVDGTGSLAQAGAPYDVALAFNVLHLVPSLEAAVATVHRLLRPGGVFISKTPCVALMNPLIQLAIPVMQAFGKAPSVTILNPARIGSALLEAGFQIEEEAWHGTKGKDMRPYFVARKL